MEKSLSASYINAASVEEDEDSDEEGWDIVTSKRTRLVKGGQIIGPTLFGPTLQQTDLSTDRMVFGPIHVL